MGVGRTWREKGPGKQAPVTLPLYCQDVELTILLVNASQCETVVLVENHALVVHLIKNGAVVLIEPDTKAQPQDAVRHRTQGIGGDSKLNGAGK